MLSVAYKNGEPDDLLEQSFYRSVDRMVQNRCFAGWLYNHLLSSEMVVDRFALASLLSGSFPGLVRKKGGSNKTW